VKSKLLLEDEESSSKNLYDISEERENGPVAEKLGQILPLKVIPVDLILKLLVDLLKLVLLLLKLMLSLLLLFQLFFLFIVHGIRALIGHD
jgi:hypothetical protein